VIANRLRGLYAIADSHLIPENAFDDSVELALQGGTRILQYRDKSDDARKRLAQACSLRTLCDEHDALLIINDDIDLAIRSGADGVHLGKNDSTISEARNLLGKRSIIGRSCYNDIESAVRAQKMGADYVAFGSVYHSPTKPDATSVTLEQLKQAKSLLSIPVCAIGGIDSHNAAAVLETGIDMIAVISALFSHIDIRSRSEALSGLFR